MRYTIKNQPPRYKGPYPPRWYEEGLRCDCGVDGCEECEEQKEDR